MFEPLPIDTRFLCYLSDPSDEKDYHPEFVPRVASGSTDCGGGLEDIKCQFQSAYYRLNKIECLIEKNQVESGTHDHLIEHQFNTREAIIALEDACVPF